MVLTLYYKNFSLTPMKTTTQKSHLVTIQRPTEDGKPVSVNLSIPHSCISGSGNIAKMDRKIAEARIHEVRWGPGVGERYATLLHSQ